MWKIENCGSAADFLIAVKVQYVNRSVVAKEPIICMDFSLRRHFESLSRIDVAHIYIESDVMVVVSFRDFHGFWEHHSERLSFIGSDSECRSVCMDVVVGDPILSTCPFRITPVHAVEFDTVSIDGDGGFDTPPGVVAVFVPVPHIDGEIRITSSDGCIPFGTVVTA